MSQPKLSPAMQAAIVDAYRDGATKHIPTVPTNPTRTYYVLRGIKTNTVTALVGRGLVIDRMVGAFRSFVLTKDGVTVARDLVGNTDNPHMVDTLADLAATLDEVIDEADAMGLLDEVDLVDLTVDQAYAIAGYDTFVMLPVNQCHELTVKGLLTETDTGVMVTWHPTPLGIAVARRVVGTFEPGDPSTVSVPIEPGMVDGVDPSDADVLADIMTEALANMVNITDTVDLVDDDNEYLSGTDIAELTDPYVMSTMPQREIDAMHARGRKARGQRKNRARRAQKAATRSRRHANR